MKNLVPLLIGILCVALTTFETLRVLGVVKEREELKMNVKSEVAITAEQARKIVESCAPRVNKQLYEQACREIRSAAQLGRHSCTIAIQYGHAQQDELAKKLKEDGYSINWVTRDGPRTDDCAVMRISW